MELRVSAIIILILFLINSSFSVFYRNNIRGDVNAGDESKYTPIFVIKENKNVEVVRSEEDEETKEEKEQEQTTQRVETPIYTNVQEPATQPPQDSSDSQSQEQEQTPPSNEEEPTPPSEEEESDSSGDDDEEPDNTPPPPSPFDDGDVIGAPG